MTMTWTDPALARRWLDVVVSLSGFSQQVLGRETVLANYAGIEPSLGSLGDVEAALAEVEAAFAAVPGHPGDWLRASARAVRATLSAVKGEGRPYLDLVRDTLELNLRPIPEAAVPPVRRRLSEQLAALGYRGSLEAQVEAWWEEQAMTGDAVIDYAREIVGRARRDTLAKVISLPEDEGLDSIYAVRDVFYSGRSHYTGNHRGWVHFNVDKRWHKDLFKYVLCHEAYPGHQAFYCLWDVLFKEGKWPLEAAYYSRNTPVSPVFEGGPETALHFIGWDEGETREAQALVAAQTLKDIQRAGTHNACYYANTGEMTREQAIDYMVQHLVLPDDAERAYRFMTDPLARYSYAQYSCGRVLVSRGFALMEGTPEGRQRFFDLIYRTPQTTGTFTRAVAEASGRAFDPFDRML